jgi:hypothetical protein
LAGSVVASGGGVVGIVEEACESVFGIVEGDVDEKK